jgi:hypothetical protein
MLVTAVLELFDQPDGLKLISSYAAEAITKLSGPLLEIRSETWQCKSSQKVRLCLEELEKTDPRLFQEIAEGEPRSVDTRTFPQEQWDSIFAMAADFAAPSEFPPPGGGLRGITEISKLVTPEDRSRAILWGSKARTVSIMGGKQPARSALVTGAHSSSVIRLRGLWPHSIRAIGGKTRRHSSERE